MAHRKRSANRAARKEGMPALVGEDLTGFLDKFFEETEQELSINKRQARQNNWDDIDEFEGFDDTVVEFFEPNQDEDW